MHTFRGLTRPSTRGRCAKNSLSRARSRQPVFIYNFEHLETKLSHRTMRLTPDRASSPGLSRRLAALALLGLAGCHASERIPHEASVPPASSATNRSGAAAPHGTRVVRSASTASSASPEHVDTGPLATRSSPIAAACRGGTIELPPDLEPCACDKVQTFVSPSGSTSIRAGDWCGPPLDEEKGPPQTSARLEKVVLSPGEPARIRIVLRNPDAELRVYRATRRYLWARFVKPSGQLLSTAGFGSGSYNDEAVLELSPGGTATVVLEVPGQVARWSGKDIITAPLAPGSYAVEIQLGSLGGKRLLPIEVK